MKSKSLCYRKDNGLVVSMMDEDHTWSATEKGEKLAHSGISFAVIVLQLSSEQIAEYIPFRWRVDSTEVPTQVLRISEEESALLSRVD